MNTKKEVDKELLLDVSKAAAACLMKHKDGIEATSEAMADMQGQTLLVSLDYGEQIGDDWGQIYLTLLNLFEEPTPQKPARTLKPYVAGEEFVFKNLINGNYAANVAMLNEQPANHKEAYKAYINKLRGMFSNIPPEFAKFAADYTNAFCNMTLRQKTRDCKAQNIVPVWEIT